MNKFINRNVAFEQAVKNVVMRVFPAATPSITAMQVLDEGKSAQQSMRVDLGDPASGANKFIWIERWGCSHIVI